MDIQKYLDNQSNQTISQLVEMVSSNKEDLDFEPVLDRIYPDFKKHWATGICYHPFYDMTLKIDRLRKIHGKITNSLKLSKHSQREQFLGHLLRDRIWVYQRGNYAVTALVKAALPSLQDDLISLVEQYLGASNEFYIRYLCWGKTNDWVISALGLDRLTTPFGVNEFWSPNLSDGKYWRVYTAPPTEDENHDITQVDTHPDDGNSVFYYHRNLLLTTFGSPFKKFMRCKLSETYSFLLNLCKQKPQSFYIYNPSVPKPTMRLGSSQLFKFQNQHLFIDNRDAPTQVFIGTNGVWIHRFTKDIDQNAVPVVLGNWSDREIHQLGLYLDTSQPNCPIVKFRTISPWMVLPIETERMLAVAKTALAALPDELFKIIQSYWNLSAVTLPLTW